MFEKILIANRGEIACRVIRTARAMGIGTVAVHSEADAGALHVELADEAVEIGPAPPAESYLRGERIIEAALATGAQAIHPGYGFLSENADFVEAVEAAGLVFIGPSAEAIRAMGLKDAAKATMAAAGVPVVPGYHGADQSPERLLAEAEAIGWPVLIKAVAGGGGKGMRLVRGPGEFAAALASAKAEARGAFGNDAVLIEKFIACPRHVEVQIFGDGRRAVHLYERDCSLQRRHQKVIEEAPAPGMNEETRAAMGAAAVRAAEAIGYAGAGTVEFIADGARGLRPDGFWFMEMNTRLQVEHPVTEAVTGIDLVEWQIRVAAGEPLPLEQHEIGLEGHAFEARLYAEDPGRGFLPVTGRLEHLRFPQGARVDTGVRAGDAISPHYDPMIAKIITHGPTREVALARLRAALSETELAGMRTNLDFLARLAAHEDFAEGRVDTGLIERAGGNLLAELPPTSEAVALAALAAMGLDGRGHPQEGFALWQPLTHGVELIAETEEPEAFDARVTVHAPGRFSVAVGDERHEITRDPVWRIDGVRRRVRLWRQGGRIVVFGKGGGSFRLNDPLEWAAGAEVSADVVVAPMPGLLRELDVAPGERVRKGERVAVLEAMKMEHGLAAPRDGIVAEILAEAGAQVEAGAPLIRLAEEDKA
ncbi:3-methylcrotonyl-CoA carboxylase alpha subunit [Meinhardsimonia xiamenensis]|jgi:3-methylcrotonyl-CoA carboxylase alpha subunit|uniref:3-methylcrotonyl-CoA carboxylase alpha subunit n=1 Tax=Meinhardsimonia xiamenensis TaxID=990712 RepID=A0A1G9FN56_9RHOB|nr:acetyl-CoA carboxylase biotin carboxylase subunit [Meinhardsimonia xiamenensis]PRX37761.1 3-methylcrotonyl-CoA carboxylase alpha subunit [Meinhardsimonia xiamenensis]SDK89817.1 3-methylcrotonyl-CoA carboxylase alpha subunit [Meinhardsimonia xiamenensis]